MLILKRILLTDKIVGYSFYPEGESEFGTVIINRVTKDVEVRKKVEGYNSSYLRHAVHRIDEYISKNNYPEKDTVAWY